MSPRDVNKPKPNRKYQDSKVGEEQRDHIAEVARVAKPIAAAPTKNTRRMKGK